MNNDLNRECLKLAIKKQELDMFLGGRGIYTFGDNPYLPGNSMLNLSSSMTEIYNYYKDEPEKRVDLELEKTLLEWLTWKSGIGVYAVFSVLSYQLKREMEGKSPFKINKDKIIFEFRKALEIYKDKLKNCKKYEGESLKEGLWEAMNKENEMNVKNYGIDIL